MGRGSKILLFALVLFAASLASAVLAMRFAIRDALAATPDLRGLSAAEAERRASAHGLKLDVSGRIFAPIPAGHVLSQSPPAGLQVRRGSPIRVAESLGPPKSAIPSLIGLPERAATLEIRRLGFTLGTVAHMPDAASPPGTVIAQTPLPNATGFAQPEVALLIADAAPVAASASVMPDLTSLTYGAAQALLAHGKFKLAPPVHQDSAANPLTGSRNSGAGPNPPERIVAQSPAPGERIQPDTPIVLTVAR